MEKKTTAMPLIAGILAIVHAVLGFFLLFGLVMAMVFMPAQSFHTNDMWARDFAPLAALWGVAAPTLIISILSMVGGIYAIMRRNWGLALAGAIASLVPTLVLGIPAVILVSLSREEFN